MSEPIAIVGMGCVLPGSGDLAGFWNTIRHGRVCVADVPADRWNHASFYDPNPRRPEGIYAQKLATIDDIRSFDPRFFRVPLHRARLMDPQQRLFLNAVRCAIEDAG